MSRTAELIHEMRIQSGLSLRALADRAETSAPTLSNYELGQIEPMLSTLDRIAAASDMEIVIQLQPRLTAAERRSLALHKAGSRKSSARNPDHVRRIARRNLEVQLKADREGRSRAYFDAWGSALEDDVVLTEMMTSTSRRAKDMRPTSPFAGVLSDKERMTILQADYEANSR